MCPWPGHGRFEKFSRAYTERRAPDDHWWILMRCCRKLLNKIRLLALVIRSGSMVCRKILLVPISPWVKKSHWLVPHVLTPQQSAKKLEILIPASSNLKSRPCTMGDDYLFRSIAHFLQWKKINTFAEVEIAVQEFYDTHSKQ